MEPINSLVLKLSKDFPQFSFLLTNEDACWWSSNEKTIYYNRDITPAELLHELGHALLGHSNYQSDIDLLKMELGAWEYAQKQLSTYARIAPEEVEEALDTYREWLHQRSVCPSCSETSPETTNGTYQCLNCGCQWRANQARMCQLRRYKITQQDQRRLA